MKIGSLQFNDFYHPNRNHLRDHALTIKIIHQTTCRVGGCAGWTWERVVPLSNTLKGSEILKIVVQPQWGSTHCGQC